MVCTGSCMTSPAFLVIPAPVNHLESDVSLWFTRTDIPFVSPGRTISLISTKKVVYP